jgi:hypothetical protein
MITKHPADLIEMFQRIVLYAEADEGEDTVEIPVGLAVALVDLLKPLRKRGGQHKSGRQKIRETVLISWARSRKEKLLVEAKAKGQRLTALQAELEASEEAAEKSKKWLPKPLKADTIKDRMGRKRRR